MLTCLGSHHEGRVPIVVLLVDVDVGTLLQQWHDVHKALGAGDHQPVLEREQHSAPAARGAPMALPNCPPNQTRQVEHGRADKDWINPRRSIPPRPLPPAPPASAATSHQDLPVPGKSSFCFAGCTHHLPQALTLPLMSSSVASLRVTPRSSLSHTSLASFLAQHW